jgi:hypothetical protein
MRLSKLLLVALLLGMVVSGCSPKMLKTRGRVVKNGQPFLPGEGEFVRVTFVPITADGTTAKDFYVAEYDSKNGTFQVAGKDRKGMPPGKYRVAIELDQKRRDLLEGAFNAESSPFIYDVSASTGEIVIDLDKPPSS